MNICACICVCMCVYICICMCLCVCVCEALVACMAELLSSVNKQTNR